MQGIVVSVLIVQILALYCICFNEAKRNWDNDIIYQVYPRSFKDSDGDGVGDLPGITSKLEHLKDMGADTLYLSPIFSSPQRDFGYDVSNYRDIAIEYGTLDDFDNLIAKAKELGLKLILDFVPNHTSDQHDWFKQSVERISPYDDYYVWKDARKGPNGERLPPNNWLSHFRGSAWEWNEKRQQYYYHTFLSHQPDLNYRNPKVIEEMENIILYWMKRGVDGFRIDAPNLLFEDKELRDEPKSEYNLPEDDYQYLNHTYTRDQEECYSVIARWRDFVDDFALKYNTSEKFLILEAFAPIPLAMRYYDVGGDPFNFVLLFNVLKNSTASDFKREIESWLNAIPNGRVSNWIVGNHDNHRVASRFGENGERADQMTMLALMMPGIVLVYNGEEIGMVDRDFTYEETVDLFGRQAGPDRYHLKSRDYERTPFQWDGNRSAGFSDSSKTWLPVHENYRVLNLELQKQAEVSHYKVFQAMTSLKKVSPVLQDGSADIILVTEEVLGIVRKLDGQSPIIMLINFSDLPVEFDAKSRLDIPESMEVYAASVASGFKKGHTFNTSALRLTGSASVVLI